jgi:cytochrome bd-type quinol oxidase subunit 2
VSIETSAPIIPSGWYEDPGNPTLLRWYDGRQWTERTDPPERIRRRRSAAWWSFAGCVAMALLCWAAAPVLFLGTADCISGAAPSSRCETHVSAISWMLLTSPLPVIVSFVLALGSKRSRRAPSFAPLVGLATVLLPPGSLVVAVVVTPG